MTTAVGSTSGQQGWVPDLGAFGARLALVRQRKGWNIAEAERACGVGRGSWALWEQDGREPSRYLTVCMQIAGAAGVDLDWLVYGPNRPARTGPDITVGYLFDQYDQAPHPALAARVIPRQRARHGDGRKRTGSIPRSPILDKPTLLTAVGAE